MKKQLRRHTINTTICHLTTSFASFFLCKLILSLQLLRIQILSKCTITTQTFTTAITTQTRVMTKISIDCLRLNNQRHCSFKKTVILKVNSAVKFASPYKFDFFEDPPDVMEKPKEEGSASKISSHSSNQRIGLETKIME